MNGQQLKRLGGLFAALLVAGACSSAPSGGASPSSGQGASPSSGSGASPAGTTSSAQKVTIRFASTYTGGSPIAPVINGALDAWEAQHKDTVNLVREEVAGEQYRTVLATDLAGNNMPDVFGSWTGHSDMSKFLDANILLNMDEYFSLSATVKAADWAPAQLANSTVDGKHYALPLESFKCFTLYNTAIFKKYNQTPPTTWDELLAVAKVFHDNGIVPIDIGSKGGNPGHLFYNVILDQVPGGEAAGEAAETSYDVSSTPFIQAANQLLTLVKANVLPADTVANGDWPASIELFNQGKAAMTYTCPWMLASVKPEIAAVTEPMYFPSISNAAVQGKDFNVGNSVHGWMINQNSFHDSTKQALIVDLMDHLLAPSVKSDMISIGGVFAAWIVDLGKANLPPLSAKVVAFAATSPQTYPGFYSTLPNPPSATAYNDAMDLLFAGGDATKVFAAFQQTVTQSKP